MIDINTNPSARELRWFALTVLVFAVLLGSLAAWHPHSLLGAATVLTIAVAVSLVFNRAFARLQQLVGLFLPGLMAICGGAGLVSPGPTGGAAVIWTLGIVLCMVLLLALPFARSVYISWMTAAAPIGWSITALLLGVVFYLILTPTGLLIRLFGRDPMQRRFDVSADSYWIHRTGKRPLRGYFRQF